jgi:nucleotide-binding universal stress UspA family protein
MAVSQQFPFETILVATDFSEKSSLTLRYAEGIARQNGARLVLVHVIDPIGYAFPKGIPDPISEDKVAREEFKRIEEEVRNQGISIHSVVQTGDICELILQAIKDYDGKLLVLGTRGKTAVAKAALGTIARQLLARATCPILVVAPDVEPQLPWAGRWRTVLLATDFSSSSLAALSSAHRIANKEFVVLYVSAKKVDAEDRACLARLRFLAPLNESHSVPVEHIVTSGEPGTIIAEVARRYEVDLVVLGSPAKVLSEEDVRSSTVLRVISGVSCPVLCIPSSCGDDFVTRLQQETANK